LFRSNFNIVNDSIFFFFSLSVLFLYFVENVFLFLVRNVGVKHFQPTGFQALNEASIGVFSSNKTGQTYWKSNTSILAVKTNKQNITDPLKNE